MRKRNIQKYVLWSIVMICCIIFNIFVIFSDRPNIFAYIGAVCCPIALTSNIMLLVDAINSKDKIKGGDTYAN